MLSTGSVKKKPSSGTGPEIPAACAAATNLARSSTSGAASVESQPCQVNCNVIPTPRNPSKAMWSQAVFQSPRSGT